MKQILLFHCVEAIQKAPARAFVTDASNILDPLGCAIRRCHLI